MTTETWSSRVRHDSDATYQEWRDEFITKLGVLVTGGYLAADETNITPAAGARPGVNTEQGYAVYHLNDSLHGTAPVYIRFGFGTNSGTTSPRVQITTGTSTNGSGVLGGTALSTIASFNGSGGAQTTDTARTSYFCCVPGFLGLNWKVNTSVNEGFFFINRTCDNTGAISATGAHAWWGGGGSTTNPTKSQAFRFAATALAFTAQSTTTSAMLGFNPQAQSATLVGADIQVMMGWTITPQVAPLFGVCGVLDSEVGSAVTFSATLVGSTARTYIGLPTLMSFASASAGTAHPKFAMLWE